MLGRLSKSFDFSQAEWEQAIRENVPPKFLELNLRAFALGASA